MAEKAEEAEGAGAPGTRKAGAVELTYPLGAVSRLTGLSPEVLRAWERRHGVVTPLRSRTSSSASRGSASRSQEE